MSSAGDYGNGASPASAPASNGAPHSGQAREVDQRPALFLMIESLETGGSERQFSELAWCLDRRAFQIHLSCIRPQGPFLKELGKMPHFPLGGSLYGLQSWWTRFRLARHLNRHEIAIAQAFDFYSNLTLVPAARLGRVPIVIGSQRQLGDLLTPAQRCAQAAVFRCCDVVVCNSHAAADRLAHEALPPRRVVVIGNALPWQAFAESVPALPRLPGVIRVGMIARMNARYKNHDVFLRVAAHLRDQRAQVEFLLVGDGPLRLELEQEAEKLGVRDRVRFLGDRRDIPAVLASMDISLMPSASESLSNVVLESMAAGVAVIATQVGGNSELITAERGALVPLNDVEALADAVRRMARNPALRARLGNNARQFAKDNFTVQRIQRQYQDLYVELLSRKGWSAKALSARAGPSRRRKLRVAIVAPTLRFVGGQAVQADLLLRYWQNDSELEARFIPVDPTFPRGLKWAERIPVVRTVIRAPIYWLALWQHLKDVDIAHIFSASYWSFLLAPFPAFLVACLRGKKTLINYRSGEARDHLRRFRTARPVLAGASGLVVPSRYLVDVFREFGLEASMVPNIVDLTQFSFRERNPVRPHLVCTRGFHPYYCLDVVVRAFAEVQRAFPDACLYLVGKGPLEAQIRSLVKALRLDGVVTFAGVASRQEIGRYYDQADIFINASRLDNMPVSVLEAFASGTPVVTTAPEGMRYLVEHERTGLLSHPGDGSALARNVVRLLREPALASRLAANAYEESRRYCWTAVREQWLAVYGSLLGGKEGNTQPKFMPPDSTAAQVADSGTIRIPWD